MKRPITVAIAGLGNRGKDTYARYQKLAPEEMKIVAVADIVPEKVEIARQEYGIAPEMCFASAEEMLQQPKLADVMLIATQDRQHVGHALPALEKGYDVLLEKPVSPDLDQCLALQQKAKETGREVTVCHVLRYTPFFTQLKEWIDAGELGEIISIDHIERVQYWHQAHSFVRGNWCNDQTTSPMILQKSCHDMDILTWLTGRRCLRVSSVGSNRQFKPENAPTGAALRCLDCPVKGDCLYDAEKIYVTSPKTGIRTGHNDWPCNVLAQNPTEEKVYEALRTGPYGRCVYHCDNNVVDHQVAVLEFEGGLTATFTMTAYTSQGGRSLRIMGTKGDVEADMQTGVIRIGRFGQEPEFLKMSDLPAAKARHGGGDYGLMSSFMEHMMTRDEADAPQPMLTSIDQSIESHVMALGAEYSRRHQGQMVELDQFVNDQWYRELV